MDLNLVRVVAEDIEYLAKRWVYADDLQEADLRIGSGVLRRLLVDQEKLLGAAWREAGFAKTPRLVAKTLSECMASGLLPHIFVANAGIYDFNTGYHTGVMIVNTLDTSSMCSPKEEDLYLEAFGTSICLISAGQGIRRLDVIKYIANDIGGVHYKLPSKIEKSLRSLFTNEFRLGDSTVADVYFRNRHPVYEELFNMGLAIVSSPDIQRFLERAAELLDAPLNIETT